MKKIGIFALLSAFTLVLFIMYPVQVYAKEESSQTDENKIYDKLKEHMDTTWKQGMNEIEQEKEIQIEGNLMERILRSMVNVFYRNLGSIRAWSLLIGTISLALGLLIFSTAKLNKKLKRFAISVLVITIPIVLLIFVIGITKLVSIFI